MDKIENNICLFGIPYAGGSAHAIYSRWSKLLSDSISIHPLDLPGHGKRMREPFADSLSEVVEDLLGQIEPIIRDTDYAFYAHSMGTTITYELVRAIQRENMPAPKAIFLSGRNPPHICYNKQNGYVHVLSDELLVEEMISLGGVGREIIEMDVLIKTFLPIVRSDYRLIELYKNDLPLHVTDANLIFLYSNGDVLVNKQDVCSWKDYTKGRFEIVEFEGGHFFINDNVQGICDLINRRLLSSEPGRLKKEFLNHNIN